MFTANNKNYSIMIKLFWGSSDKSADEISNTKNAVQLDVNNIEKLTLTSSLLTPWIYGSFDYVDNKKLSKMSNFFDIPIVYGKIEFFQCDGSGGTFSAESNSVFEQEVFSEIVVIDSFDMISDDFDTTTYRFNFSMSDSIALESTINPVSTFTDSTYSKPVKSLVKELFSASNIRKKFDFDTIDITTEVPFVSSPNSTFVNSIDYVYRKIFDYNFSNTIEKDFCKIVYNNGKQQYEWWRFGNIGKEAMFKCSTSNGHYKDLRENITVTIGKESGATPNSAEFFNSGKSRELHYIFGDKTYTEYDYLKNEFSDITNFHTDISFIDHSDSMYLKQKSKSSIVKNKSNLDKMLKFDNHYSRYRDNGSIYDIFNKMIFETSYVRVTTPGCLGRYAGNGISLKFNNADSSPYKYSNGIYIITGLTHTLGRNGKEWSFATTMDLFKPYSMEDSVKEEMH